MKFEALEAARKKVQDYKLTCEENDQKRTEAQKAVSEAKAEAQALMDRQIDGEDVIDELARAQSRVTVAEAKYGRLIQSIGESDPEMSKEGISFYTVQSQILAYPTNGLHEDMKDELEAMQAAHDSYLKSVEEALVKFYKLRQEARGYMAEAERIFGREVTTMLPTSFEPSLLRPWGLWWGEYDAHNEMGATKKKALETVEGVNSLPELKSNPYERVIPQPKPTLGPKTWVTDDGTVMTRQSDIQIPEQRKELK